MNIPVCMAETNTTAVFAECEVHVRDQYYCCVC